MVTLVKVFWLPQDMSDGLIVGAQSYSDTGHHRDSGARLYTYIYITTHS